LTQLWGSRSRAPWTCRSCVNMLWKEIMELFAVIYSFAIYDSFRSLKTGPENWFSPLVLVAWCMKCVSWSLDQLWSMCSCNPWICMSCVSRRWKDLLKLFKLIYVKAICETIKTPKINPKKRVLPLDSMCLVLKCTSWSLDQLWGSRSRVPWTCRSCVSMHWKELLKLFNLVYSSFIYLPIWYLKLPSKVWVLSFYTAPTCWIF